MNDEHDLDKLAKQFLDLWQDQMTALAADPKTIEAAGRMFALSAPLMSSFTKTFTNSAGGFDKKQEKQGDTEGNGKTKPPPRAASPAAASGNSGYDLASIERRLADVERRLAELEPGLGAPRRQP